MDNDTLGFLILGGLILVGFLQGFIPQRIKANRLKQAKLAQERAAVGSAWGSTHGSAFFMSANQILQAGLAIKAGDVGELLAKNQDKLPLLLLGCQSTQEQPDGIIQISDQPGHILTVAPTRSGKGVSAVIPNLLTYAGSTVVMDIKGENWAVTSDRRDDYSRLFAFAPFKGLGSWNPFNEIDEDQAGAWEDARMMSELLIISRGVEAFWENEARNLLTGVILFVHLTREPDKKNMAEVRHLLTQVDEPFDLTLAEMASHQNSQVRRSADMFLHAEAKVKASIISTLNSQMGIWDSEQLANSMSKGAFTFKMLKEEPTSIYFILPPDKLATYAPLVRLFMGLAVKALLRDEKKPELPVLFMLDEFPAFGRIKVIEDSIAYLAGYGVKLWIFAQDLKQLAATYGDKAESIIANCGVKQFFGVSDYDTAKMVSLMCGDTTVPSFSYSTDAGFSFKSSPGTGTETIGESGRALVTPDDVMSLPPEVQFLFYRGQKPILTGKLSYLENPEMFSEFQGDPYFRPNPFHS